MLIPNVVFVHHFFPGHNPFTLATESPSNSGQGTESRGSSPIQPGAHWITDWDMSRSCRSNDEFLAASQLAGSGLNPRFEWINNIQQPWFAGGIHGESAQIPKRRLCCGAGGTGCGVAAAGWSNPPLLLARSHGDHKTRCPDGRILANHYNIETIWGLSGMIILNH